MHLHCVTTGAGGGEIRVLGRTGTLVLPRLCSGVYLVCGRQQGCVFSNQDQIAEKVRLDWYPQDALVDAQGLGRNDRVVTRPVHL